MKNCSELPRIMQCPASAVAPDIKRYSDSEAARQGKAAHELVACMIMKEKCNVESLAKKYDVPVDGLWIARAQFKKIWEEEDGQGVSFGEYFPSPQVEFKIKSKDLDLSGVVDLLSYTDDYVAIFDWKNGWAEMDFWAQVKSYAAIIMEAHPEYGQFYCGFGYLKTAMRDSELFGADDIMGFVKDLALKMKYPDRYNSGTHCNYCPRLQNCPELRSAIVLRDPKIPSELTAEKIREYQPVIKSLEEVIVSYKKARNAFIRKSGPVDMGNGMELYEEKIWLEEVEVDKAFDTLSSLFTAEEIRSMIKFKNKDTVDAIIKGKAAKGRKGKDVDKFWSETMKPFSKTKKPKISYKTRKIKPKEE